MKKILKIAAIVLIFAFIIAQFFRPDRNNPAIVEAETLDASTAVPADVKNIMQTSCRDCHSNTSVYPWYSNVTPINWLLANHISDGRKQMNFSVWNTYTPKRKMKKLDEICEQLEQREMPLPSYLWIHRYSELSESQSKALCDWATEEKQRIQESQPPADPAKAN